VLDHGIALFASSTLLEVSPLRAHSLTMEGTAVSAIESGIATAAA
jgi:hypothetical protein